MGLVLSINTVSTVVSCLLKSPAALLCMQQLGHPNIVEKSNLHITGQFRRIYRWKVVPHTKSQLCGKCVLVMMSWLLFSGHRLPSLFVIALSNSTVWWLVNASIDRAADAFQCRDMHFHFYKYTYYIYERYRDNSAEFNANLNWLVYRRHIQCVWKLCIRSLLLLYSFECNTIATSITLRIVNLFSVARVSI